jgi:hypothetical protein
VSSLSAHFLLLHIINFAPALRRLSLRNKTASETIRPFLSDLGTAIRLIPLQTVPSEGRNIIITVSSTIQNVLKWAKISADNNPEEVIRCKVRNFPLHNYIAFSVGSQAILHSLLETTITACIPFVHSSLAQKAFDVCFPRMALRSVSKPGREESDKAIQDATV